MNTISNSTSLIHLLSGGLDSVTLLYDLINRGYAVRCLCVDYGQAHVKELEFAHFHCNRLNIPFQIITIPPLGGLTKAGWIVPNRNAILLSLAVNLAVQHGFPKVTIGCNKDDETEFPDCRMAFIQMFNTMLTTAEVHVEVWAPYLEWTKAKIARRASDFALTSDMIWTCYAGTVTPCGECPACKKLAATLK